MTTAPALLLDFSSVQCRRGAQLEYIPLPLYHVEARLQDFIGIDCRLLVSVATFGGSRPAPACSVLLLPDKLNNCENLVYNKHFIIIKIFFHPGSLQKAKI